MGKGSAGARESKGRLGWAWIMMGMGSARWFEMGRDRLGWGSKEEGFAGTC